MLNQAAFNLIFKTSGISSSNLSTKLVISCSEIVKISLTLLTNALQVCLDSGDKKELHQKLLNKLVFAQNPWYNIIKTTTKRGQSHGYLSESG